VAILHQEGVGTYTMLLVGYLGIEPKWRSKNEKTTCLPGANARLRSANAPLMMPNEGRIKLNKAPFI
jgi:hypothetical protein